MSRAACDARWRFRPQRAASRRLDRPRLPEAGQRQGPTSDAAGNQVAEALHCRQQPAMLTRYMKGWTLARVDK